MPAAARSGHCVVPGSEERMVSQAARRLYDELRALLRDAQDTRRAKGEPCSLREMQRVLRHEPHCVTLHAQRLSDWFPDDPAKARVPREADRDKILALVRLWSDWAGKPEPKNSEKYWRDLIEAAQPARDSNAGPTESLVLGKPIDQWEPLDLGVHRAIDPDGNRPGLSVETLPQYVRRSHDAELRNRLGGCRSSTMLVAVGGSATGKTRACYEAVKELQGLSGWAVVCPADGAELAQLLAGGIPGQCLLWLNETQLYLDGDGGPAVAAGLRRLLIGGGEPVVVVGSMWPEYWQTFTARPDAGGQDRYGQVRELLGLKRVYKIDVPDDFSTVTAAEWANLESLAADDPRLAIAFQTAGPAMKITQVLAGGEMLVDRYEHMLGAHSRAVITAAMDIRCLGHRQPLAAPLLEQAVPGYLTASQRAVDTDWFGSDLSDATESVRGIRALEPNRTAPGMGPPDGYVLHDYLDQHGRAVRRSTRVPAGCWDALAAHATGADNCNALSATAECRRLYQYTVRLAIRGAEAGSVDCMCRLGSRFFDAGHDQEAEEWLRRAIEAGSGWAVGRIAAWLKSAEREDEIEPVVRGAAERGHGQSTAELIWRLQDTGRSREAQVWMKRLLVRQPQSVILSGVS